MRDLSYSVFSYSKYSNQIIQIHIYVFKTNLNKRFLTQIYSLKIRHFILLFLLLLPVAMIPQLNTIWWIPILTMLIAYPLLSLDQIGVELENPFSTANHSHLPLNDISATIERNLLSFLHLKQ